MQFFDKQKKKKGHNKNVIPECFQNVQVLGYKKGCYSNPYFK